MRNQLPLFLSTHEFRSLPINKKYEKIFDGLDLSGISEYNRGVGANGIPQHALLRAFIIRSLENLRNVPALIRFLNANPYLTYLCGFRNQNLPDSSQFYRYLKKTNISVLQGLLYKANNRLIEANSLKVKITAVDSKPVMALSKHNNFKNPRREQKDKNRKINRHPKATLGYYSYVPKINPETKKKDFIFFWGYRSHAIVDSERYAAI